MIDEERTKSFKLSKNGSFKLNEDELRNQIDNYETLPITKAYRGISSLLIVFALLVTYLLYFFGFVDTIVVVCAMVIYIPLIYFVFKGHKWAIVTVAVVWTIDKIVGLAQTFNPLIILWWLVFISYFYKAYLVEKMRKKNRPLD